MIALAAKQKLAGGFTRRGACPALSAPMQTGDGLLVRLNPVAGGLSPKALIGLSDAAEAYGNGVIEVTARGSLQIRGLTERSAGEFAAAVDKLGIAARTGVPVQTGALAGLDPDEIADPTALAQMIREGIATAGLDMRLGPKVSVVVDGGGRSGLQEVAADIRLTAVPDGGRPVWQVAIAGDAKTARKLGVAKDDDATCDAALSVLAEVAARGRETRARDLSADRLPSVLRYLEVSCPTLPPSGLPAISPTRGEISSFEASPALARPMIGEGGDEGMIPPLVGEMAGRPEGGAKGRDVDGSLIGLVPLTGTHVALGVALPFGHTTATLLKIIFAEKARSLDVIDIRPAPKRTLVAICGTVEAAEALRKQAEALGLVTSPDDPRQAISACPGAPDCASGHIPARRLAAELASEYGSLLDGSMHLHVSGCAKGCAHPGKAELTVIGSEAGTGLVLEGTARDEPLAFAAGDGGRRGLAGIAALVSAERREGETTAQTIQRIGLSALAETFNQGGK